jgi:hypothetical protein
MFDKLVVGVSIEEQQDTVATSALQNVYSSTLGFDDIIIDSLKGVGAITAAFKVKIPKLDDRDYIMKVNADKDIQEYGLLEASVFQRLNETPMNPSIPPLIFKITSMSKSLSLVLK